MTDLERMLIKGALLKCAEENKNKITPTCYIVVLRVCESAVERITELEDLLENIKRGKIKWVDYGAGEDCYEDEYKGHWEMIK